MRKKIIVMMMIVAIVSLFVVSCEKDLKESGPPVLCMSMDSLWYLIDFSKDVSTYAGDVDIYQEFHSLLKSSNSYGYEYPTSVYQTMIDQARFETDIMPCFFKLDVRYKYSYQHLKQPDSHSCSWTSYTIATGCVSNVNSCYPVTKKQVYYIRDKCEYLMRKAKDPTTAAMLMTTLEDFSEKYDASSRVRLSSAKPAKRLEAIKLMLSHINNYHTPFLVIGTYYYKDGSKGGHYLVVHSIDWRGSASTSTVYYTDCSRSDQGSLSSNLRTMNFALFLDQMIIPGQVKNYNMLFMMPN